jgi:YegS/Rv2252/BmrU family lipid kinase
MESFRQAKQCLAELGLELTNAETFERVDQLTAAVQAAIRENHSLIVVGGGDGTYSAIARYFVGTAATLGVLPLGTGNAFARDLGIPSDVGQACRIVTEGKPVRVDLGRANDVNFLNVATVGLTTRVALALTDPMKKRFGRFVYVIALIKALATVRPFHVRLECDGVITEFSTLLLVIGNGRYHAGPFLLSPTASIVDGRLTVYALATTHKAAFFRFALALVTGHQGNLPEVRTASPVRGVVLTIPERRVTIDGEVAGATPLKFGVLPGALRVMVPHEFEG